MSIVGWCWFAWILFLAIVGIRCAQGGDRDARRVDRHHIEDRQHPWREIMARIRKPDDAGQGPEDQLAGSPPASADGGPEPGAEQPPLERTEVIAADEHHAGHLRETVPSIFHFASLSQAFKVIDQHAYKLYRDHLLADCGSPTDPIEIMIIEQLALAHFNLGLLSCKAANAGKVEAVGVYSGAAARMMGEFRRSALALQAYRAASRQLAHDPTKDLVIPREDADTLDDQSGKDASTTNWMRGRRSPMQARRSSLIPNPPRSRANPPDRRKRPGISPEGRERLRVAALARRPWEHSTGPRTHEGKARSARTLLRARRPVYSRTSGRTRRCLRPGDPDGRDPAIALLMQDS